MAKRRLEVDIIVDERGGTRGFTRMGREVDTLESRMRRMGATGTRVLGGAVVGAAIAAGYGIKKSVDEAREANKVGAQSEAVIESTGGVAKVTAGELAGLSGAISLKAGIDDEAIQSGGNLLLTFKEIHDETDRGKSIYDRALQVTTDLSVAMGKDLTSSAVMVGKALNDPVKGAGALSKAGVQLTEQQKEQIETFVESGQTMKAQQLILRELESQFGGSAAAQADSFDKLKVGVENAEEAIGQIFIPILSDAADEVTEEFLPRIEKAGGAISKIFDNKDLTLDDKLARAGKVIKREFGDIPPVIAEAFEDAVPIVAGHAGRIGVTAAKGTVEGFIDADVWGKLAIGGFLLAKFGGLGAFGKLGSKGGRAFGTGFIGGLLAVELAKQIKDIVEGHKLDAPTSETFVMDLDRFFADPKASIEGGDKVRVDTELGDLIFNAATRRVIDAEGTKLQRFIGQSLNSKLVGGLQDLELGKVGRRGWDDFNQESHRGIEQGKRTTKQGIDEISHLARSAHFVAGDDPWGIARGFARTWEKSGRVTRQSLSDITHELDKMSPAAAREAGQMMVQIAGQMRQKGQLSKSEVEKLRSAVVSKLGQMASQGTKKGEALGAGVGGSFGDLSGDVAAALENIGGNVSQTMKRLGASNIPDFQLQVLEQKYGGSGSGKGYVDQLPELGRARGGPVTVPGQGLHDSVPVTLNGALSAVVAPGETLATFTRHQRPMVDEALAYRWGVSGLGDFFNTYDRPHWMARGGLHEPRLRGPDPLRSLGQAGIHKGFLAAEAYVKKHRPKSTGSSAGVAGYTGPPANMQQLGDNAWVDSHTLAVAAYLANKFGLAESSTYRSPGHNAAVGGVPNSLHTHGSPSNPGAVDFVPPSTAALSFAQTHIAGLEEAMIHDVGSGLHLHLGFFDRGGVISGRVSYFGGGATAGGSTTSQPGVALNLDPSDEPGGWNNDTTQGWMEASNAGDPVYAAVTIAGKTANLPITDLGPAGWTGRSIDVTEGGVRKLGLDPASFPTDSIGKAVIQKGAVGGEKPAPPATKQQKHTLGSLRHQASEVLREGRGLKHRYEKFGGTPQGKKALHRMLKFAKEAARRAKAGDRDEAKDLIDKAREQIDKARDSYEKAQENVFTPGLKDSKLPGVVAGEYDPSLPFSAKNLPGLGALPKGIRDMLRSPGLDRADQHDVLEGALTEAGFTDTKADDAAALNALLALDRDRRKKLKEALQKTYKDLRAPGKTQRERDRLAEKAGKLRSDLGTVAGDIGSDRERIEGLNEGSTPADRADMQLARAESTAGKDDDIVALQHLEDLAKKELQRAEKSGDPREIAEATRNLKDAADALRDATPTAEDWASRDLALAELTEGSEDDRVALHKLLDLATVKLDAALTTADPRDDIEAAQDVKRIKDAVESIEATTSESASELKGIREELAKSRATAESEMAVGLTEARRALADLISGELGPRIVLQAQTAGNGSLGTMREF